MLKEIKELCGILKNECLQVAHVRMSVAVIVLAAMTVSAFLTYKVIGVQLENKNSEIERKNGEISLAEKSERFALKQVNIKSQEIARLEKELRQYKQGHAPKVALVEPAPVITAPAAPEVSVEASVPSAASPVTATTSEMPHEAVASVADEAVLPPTVRTYLTSRGTCLKETKNPYGKCMESLQAGEPVAIKEEQDGGWLFVQTRSTGMQGFLHSDELIKVVP